MSTLLSRCLAVLVVGGGILAVGGGSVSSFGQVVGGGGGGGGVGGAFFGPAPGVAYNPEPSAVFTGHNVHVGATVTADNKYVQLNMVPQQSAVLGVQNFIFVTEGGFVGTSGAAGGTTTRPPVDPGIRGSSSTPPAAAPTSAPLTGVLARPGMTRLAGL